MGIYADAYLYALAMLPLIQRVDPDSSVIQTWFADDATATGKLENLREWWSALVTLGPKYGYHVNPMKTHLITKQHLQRAEAVFGDTQIRISSEGGPHLGAALGT